MRNEEFDIGIPIFIVNLKKDIEKKQYMERILKKYKLKYEFVPAIYGKDLDSKIVKKVYNKKKAINLLGRELSLPEIGCALSHKNIYEKIVNEKIEKAIIFEDDIFLDKKFLEIYNNTFELFPKDWECILLCYYRNAFYKKNYCISFRNRKKISKNLKIIRFTALMHSTAGYIINQRGAKKLLKTLKKEKIYKPIDHYTGDDKHINLYGIYPKTVDIYPFLGFNSSIAEERRKTVSSRIEKPDKIRSFLKKIHLFYIFKKINLIKQKIQFFLERWIYFIFNIHKCIKKTKSYK